MLHFNKYFLQMIFLLLPLMACEASIIREDIVHININNNIGSGVDLTIHCKSKDDDLGVQVIPYQGNYTFQFRPNILGTTLFFCSFAWRDESHSFDIYSFKRDSGLCTKNCNWSIRSDAAYWLDPTPKHHDIRYPWP
ncbi:hypothetical protein ACOSQ2_027377 [Xanthoceras sorbifolium]